jgi:hypothetical protein
LGIILKYQEITRKINKNTSKIILNQISQIIKSKRAAKWKQHQEMLITVIKHSNNSLVTFKNGSILSDVITQQSLRINQYPKTVTEVNNPQQP